MTTQNIIVEGLPQGYEVTTVYINDVDDSDNKHTVYLARVVARKIEPREIMLVETDEERSVSYGEWYEDKDGLKGQWTDSKYGSFGVIKYFKPSDLIKENS